MISNQFKNNGFTLVELAIVLMIIGLLIGGILKGQELIGNARILTTGRQLTSYDAAVTTFRDMYGAIPGDMTNASHASQTVLHPLAQMQEMEMVYGIFQ